MLDKKGFLFTVTVFLILTYILLSISVWVKSIESSERSFSEFYKESTVELTIQQITPAKMDNVTNMIMTRNLARLDEHSIDSPLKPGDPDENSTIRGALFDLLVNGSASPSYFQGTVISNETNTSLVGWVDNLNTSLKAIGVYVDYFRVYNFNVSQSDIDQLNYTFDMDLGLKDYTNTSSVSRTYHLSNYVPISGLVDPALARISKDKAGDNLTIYRQFFFDKNLYPNYSSISVSKLGQTVSGGQGWFYGPMAMANSSDHPDKVFNANDIAPSQRHNYILVGTYADIVAFQPDNAVNGIYDQFGGYIVTSSPDHPTNCTTHPNEANTFNPIKYSNSANGTCDVVGIDPTSGATTGKPFIIAPGFDPATAPECPRTDVANQTTRCVLMLNAYRENQVADDPSKKLVTTGAGLFSLEVMRDFVMCGYYTHDPAAPSFMQRLLNDTYTRASPDFGIETFVIGIYANSTSVYDTHSRLDTELFTNATAYKIRGLPGCRNFASCADDPSTGIFALTPGSISNYDLGQIACNNGAAGCDQ